jgi:hypothetical protein
VNEPTNGEIRAWARENGHIVADRGRIPASVMAAHAAAHQKVHSPDDRAHAPALGGANPPDDEAIWSPAADVYGWDEQDGDERDGDEQDGAVDAEPARFQRPWAAAPSAAPADAAPAAWGPPPGPPPPAPAWGSAANGAPAAWGSSTSGAPPAWGRPTGPGSPPPAAPPAAAAGRDSGALPALLLGIVPIFGGILGIVFGAISLRRIRRTNQSGRGMATAGIVLGCLWLLFFAGIAIAGALREPDRGADGAVTNRGTATADTMRTGDCLSSIPDGTIRTVQLVPCGQPHLGEVYATFALPVAAYPGDDKVASFAEDGCIERLTPFVGAGREAAFDVFYLVPVRSSWDTGDRDMQCILTTDDRSLLPPGTAKAG